MRIFAKLRNSLSIEPFLKDEVSQLKKNTNHLFKIVFERLDNLEDQITPKLPKNRRKIGLSSPPKD